ncbi:MAG: aspartyl protease family protein [Bryobacterales bacterium]|nr:aspartyl protease family protein [Bryobacterales bacterium]
MKLSLFIFGAVILSAGPLDDTLATGRKALANDGVATAWRLAQKALMDAPESAAAHEFVGEVHFRRGEFAEADAEFKAAVEWDPRFALAWWGLGRVAECSSMNKTAVEDFHRAYELNPNDRRILAAWISHLRGQARTDALKRYTALASSAAAEAGNDSKELAELRQRVDLALSLNGRQVMALTSPYKASAIPLQAFVGGATHVRTYGLDVLVNGKPARLVLDTGADGIVLSHPAADRAGLTRIADATVHGLGDNAKLTGGYRAIAERFQIGDVEYHDAPISVANQSFTGIEDGLIGANTLSEFLITLDFAHGKLRLNPLSGYRPGGVDLQDRTISSDMENATRVFRFGHLLLVPVRVGNAGNRLFVLDTGAGSTLISYELAAAVSNVQRDDKTGLRGLNGRVGDVYQTGNLVLAFAGFEQKNLAMTAIDTWQLSRALGTEISGFLGLPVLDLFTLTIDYRNGLVKFERTQ